jgi:putative ABC transport system substrate-binding protein
MRWRDFVTVIGSATVFWPMGAHAQQLAKPVIGFLHSASSGQYVGHLAAFRKRVERGGVVEGDNVSRCTQDFVLSAGQTTDFQRKMQP